MMYPVPAELVEFTDNPVAFYDEAQSGAAATGSGR